MRYVLNLPFVCEKPRKNVVVGFRGDAFSFVPFLCWRLSVSPMQT